MAMTDPLGDMLTRIRNGQQARKDSILTPASKLRTRVLDVLQREGYIRGYAEEELAGQKPVVTKAKKSIAQFKLREGMPIGCKVTLRRDRMLEFLDRLVTIALPRVRDFRGLNPRSFDGRGNYALGLKEQIIFPEINYDQIDTVRGMDVIITTTAKTDEEARELLRLFNFPFPAEEEKAAA